MELLREFVVVVVALFSKFSLEEEFQYTQEVVEKESYFDILLKNFIYFFDLKPLAKLQFIVPNRYILK